MLRTSLTHPLQIAAVTPPAPHAGRIGITFCPGKRQASSATGGWDRDLGLDLDAVAAWGASAVLTLVEDHELGDLGVPSLGEAVRQRHMAWFHAPIPDVSVPDAAFEAAWDDIGPALRHRLRNGFDVVVHCKGGLGRAGTIAARLLVELGEAPAAAVAAVRAVRPGAIETSAQETYVLQLADASYAQPDASFEAVRDRARGALLGLAVGDAVGTTLEFKRRDSYTHLTDMVGGGPFGLTAGQWTDDTAMALALADSLSGSAFDEQAVMARFVDWWKSGTWSCTGRCFDIGITTRQALSRWQRTGNAHSGSTDPLSAGNGSLMRLAPVAVRYWKDRDQLKDVAARQSKTTHAAPEAVDACVYYAGLMADAIEGRPAAEILTPGGGHYAGKIADIARGSWRGKSRHAIAASGYVAHSLEASLWAVGRHAGYRDAVLAAANLGDDADTTGAITGQLAGALYGASGIPAGWLEKLAWREKIVAMADELLEAS
jgi:ADP-ribosyl-[dinitrogen reductase] hydrolase